jgi:hypothetical protein
MLRCREVSKLVSESMERELPMRQRLPVWMHLAMCRLCAGFDRHLRALRRMSRANPDRLVAGPDDPQPTLSQEACERIKTALRDRGL